MASPFAYLPHRAILSLNGPDTITLLERLVTHATDNWTSGETRYGALLTPQGKVIADYLALRTADGVLLDVSKDHVEALAKRLKMFRLRAAVEIEILDDLIVVTGLDDAPDGVRPIAGAQHVYLDPRYDSGRLRGLATPESWDAASEEAASLDAYHRDRISHGVPEQGADFDTADVFPADINMDVFGGVALNKGCFVGQEVVSRMHRRGKIRKRTLRVTAPAETDLDPGTDILAAAPIGRMTSANGALGLAQIRIDRLIKAEADGLLLTANDISVSIDKPDWLIADLDSMEQT